MINLKRRLNADRSFLYVFVLQLSLGLLGSTMTAALILSPSAVLADDDDGGDDSDSDSDSDGGRGHGGGNRSGGGFGGRSAGSGGEGRSFERGGPGGGSLLNLFRPRNARTKRRARKAAPRRARPQRTQRSRPARSRPRRQRPPAIVLPERAAREIIALGLTGAELDRLLAAGYTVLQEAQIVALDATILRLSVPAGTSIEQAREDVRAINADAVTDFNDFYRSVGTLEAADCRNLSCGAANQIAWPLAPGTRGGCVSGATIGIIDTGINLEHEALRDANLTALPFDTRQEEARGSSAQHGTAVAAILLSNEESRAPGLVPDVRAYAVDAFFRAVAAGNVSDERTDAFTLVRAMDVMSQQPLSVLNLSLAGPPNTAVKRMIDVFAEESVTIVAAAGNAGPRAKPLYPAAYDEVIGVTAVDHTNRVFRRANQGDHIEFAAPGVEVWTAASIRGVKPKTGTSFATPFVTAVVALHQSADASLGPDGIRRVLASNATDLGATGRDPVFGHGLVQAQGLCAADPPEQSDDSGPAAQPSLL